MAMAMLTSTALQPIKCYLLIRFLEKFHLRLNTLKQAHI